MSKFVDELNRNTRNATIESLLQTIGSAPNRTIGEVHDALSEEPDADYMFETFRNFTFRDVANAILAVGSSGDEPAASVSSSDEEAEGAEAVEVVESAPRKGGKSKSGKGRKGKSGKGKKARKGKKDTRAKEDQAPSRSGGGAGPGAIKRLLKKSDEPMSVGDIAKALGVDSDVVKPALGDLLDDGAIEKEGKARGTKYFLVA